MNCNCCGGETNRDVEDGYYVRRCTRCGNIVCSEGKVKPRSADKERRDGKS